VRSPRDEAELVRAAAAGDPAADAALWDEYGPRTFAFSHRVLGEAGAAADAAQDAFLMARAELAQLQRTGEGFGIASLQAARRTSFEVVGRRQPATPRGRLSAATGRLRPQQRAALALSGLELLSYAEIAAVLGIGVESVPALLARARLRLHDELHGTALAAAAVRSPDCEDVLPLLAAAADGELDAADAGWADPHVERCPTCVRSIRAMDEAAATYAAWSPAPSPSWLREATLADAEAEAPTAAPAGAATTRTALPAALLGATCVTGAFAALLVGTAQTLHAEGPVAGGARLPDGARSMHMAAAPAAAPSRQRARRAHDAGVARSSVFVVARVAAPPSVSPVVAHAAPPAPRPQRKRRPATEPSAPAPAPAPVASDVAPDEPSVEADAATTTAVAATASPAAQTPSSPDPPPATTTTPPSKLDAVTPPPPVPTAGDDRWASGICGWHDRRRD
jgi:DNA-directed RNA polymerase specialized sigma24 family protein